MGVVNTAKSHINSGALEKVVVSRTRTVPLAKERLADLFIQACHERAHAFVVYYAYARARYMAGRLTGTLE